MAFDLKVESYVTNNLIEQALTHHRADRLDEAVSLYNQALIINPQDSEALHLLGLATLQGGQPQKAVTLIRQAAQLQPRNWSFQANLAMALAEAGNAEEALTAFRQAAKLNPEEPQLQMGIANCHAMCGRHAEAEVQLRKIARRFPSFALAWFNLANAVRDQKRNEEAIGLYRRAIQLDADLVDAHNNLGTTLQKLSRFDEAEQAYRQALALNPQHVLAQCNLISVLIDRGRFAEAEVAGRRAVACAPRSAVAHSFLGAAIGHQGRLHEALEFHRKAAELDPDNLRTLIALGTALHELGNPTAGLPFLERAVALAPASWEAHFSLAAVNLSLGRFHEGWREFSYRPARVQFVKPSPDVNLSFTLPPDLTGQHVCLFREQGLGDQLFFLRFAALLKARGARITYHSHPKIASILSRVPVLDSVIQKPAPIPPADHVVLIGDLPMIVSDAPSPVAAASQPATKQECELPAPLALSPLADQIADMKGLLARLGPPPYIGLTWRAGIAPEDQRDVAWLLFKQISPEKLGDALHGLDATVVAIQRHPLADEIQRLAGRLGKPVHDLTALNEDLEAMLALLALLDDYVGPSNTNMHLRAGLGKTARVLVPCPAEWRWMATGDESPWFREFRIYRQNPEGDWNPALNKLRSDLTGAFRICPK